MSTEQEAWSREHRAIDGCHCTTTILSWGQEVINADRMSVCTQYPMGEQKQKSRSLPLPKSPKKLGVNVFQYINGRVSRKFSMPALSELLIENARPQPG